MILQILLSKVTYNWGIHKAIYLEEANRQTGRHCSNKYKLARKGENDKEKDEDLEKVNNTCFDKERCSLGLI